MQVTALILYDEKRRVLLQHRTDDAPTFPGHWGFFGGGVEQGETPEDAVKREALEELAYALRRPRLWAIKRFAHQGLDYTQHVFLEAYDGSELILGEGQGMGWFLPSETKELAMISHAREVVEAFGRDDSIDCDDKGAANKSLPRFGGNLLGLALSVFARIRLILRSGDTRLCM